LIEASLKTEIKLDAQTVVANDVLDMIAKITSVHPLAYAIIFRNVYYVDISGAKLGGAEYIAAQILKNLNITCDHFDFNTDHNCDYCAEVLSECIDADKDHACDYGCDKVYGECADADKDGTCDYGCGKEFEVTTEPIVEPTEPATEPTDIATDPVDEDKLSAGAIAGISVGAVFVLGLGGFSIYWFVIKKKTFAALFSIFSKK
jgi:hypothetical protein